MPENKDKDWREAFKDFNLARDWPFLVIVAALIPIFLILFILP
jgi:hypothetical protein